MFHTRRARWTARRVLKRSSARFALRATADAECDATNWWQKKDSLKELWDEFAKFPYYCAKY